MGVKEILLSNFVKVLDELPENFGSLLKSSGLLDIDIVLHNTKKDQYGTETISFEFLEEKDMDEMYLESTVRYREVGEIKTVIEGVKTILPPMFDAEHLVSRAV